MCVQISNMVNIFKKMHMHHTFRGNSLLKRMVTLKTAPSQSVPKRNRTTEGTNFKPQTFTTQCALTLPSLPGIPVSHTIMFCESSLFFENFAKNPGGWSIRHCFLSSIIRFSATPLILLTHATDKWRTETRRDVALDGAQELKSTREIQKRRERVKCNEFGMGMFMSIVCTRSVHNTVFVNSSAI